MPSTDLAILQAGRSRRLTPLALLIFFWVSPLLFGNTIESENRKMGTLAWLPAHPARDHEVEGYASRTSVNRGDTIQFKVSTADPTFSLQVFRMGWYSGLGARAMTERIELPGVRQPVPVPEPDTQLIECNWSVSYTLAIPDNAEDPTDWASGVYLVKLISGTSHRDSFMIFVVRDDRRPSDLLLQSPVTTYQAYNNWGGNSLYSGSPVARKVSFDRPYNITQGNGASKFLNNGGWEYNMLRWLEREGYDVTYCTNIDTHENPALLLSHRAFLSVGHDEYWSWEMRANVTAARDRGIHLGFFSANDIYWQIRFEASKATGEPDRTVVCYRFKDLDPILRDGNPSNDYLTTIKFRELGYPEDALIGVMYVYNPVDADIVIEKADHWIFEGTGLNPGDHLPGLLGYEVDRMFGNAPFQTERLAHSPFTKLDGEGEFSDMTIYTAPGGAIVFAAGTIQWSWGLDDYNAPSGRTSRLNPQAQRITRNILNRMAGRNRETSRRRSVRR